MAWNEPGPNDNKNKQDDDPWSGGGRKKPSGPPDLEKLIREFLKSWRGLLSKGTGNGPRSPWPAITSNHFGRMLGGVLAIIIGVWILSGLFIVNPAEQAVILRFGKYTHTLDAGLHWIPRFIDAKYLIDTQKIYSFSLKGDFLTKSSDQSDLVVGTEADQKIVDTSESESRDKAKNLVYVELSVQYRINNPRDYLFKIADPDQTIQQAAISALSDITGQMKIDEVLTVGRESLTSGVRDRLKQILVNYRSGLDVVAVTLRTAQAPEEVRKAFNDVIRAGQDRQTYRQQAEAYRSQVVPLAKGVASRIFADANAYSQQVVLNAQANVANFNALLKVYSTAPGVTRERMYLDTMQTVLTGTTKVLVDANAGNNLLYLPLDKMLRANKPKFSPTMNDLPAKNNTANQNTQEANS